MSEGTKPHSHFKLYMIIFVALAALTAIEVVIPGMASLTKFQKGSSLTFLALGKAFLVAYFYMHLNEETKWLKFVAAIPCSAFLYAAVLVIESMFR
ncbi:prokaryotic cytochrome C oxidase subunit IV [Bacteriovorax sp. BSW11_IV]|uniref:cytochrome C oxidase subunit IV family protein n=1 Tax=Bacteriovorax sp. BSW11_IV TaxID=1353529 RepID=UPI000389EEB9|nr:cytochrome C oxidase subunit IV family protein [Bacteriovorax sp. BSW11_IV]EQC47075.1 prokaryotic cytochrome C oxidase subunit IV [Bacteriovorax sp. BSW11_IV]